MMTIPPPGNDLTLAIATVEDRIVHRTLRLAALVSGYAGPRHHAQ